MIVITYPRQKPALQRADGQEKVFCPVRKKWVALLPEEWVRQNFILYLHHILGYPLSLMAVEKQIQIGERIRRFDIAVHDRQGQALLLVECKEMDIPFSESWLQQAAAYNVSVQSPCIIVTNGRQCVAIAKKGDTLRVLEQLPVFEK